jgi:hypothetical protein
MKKLILICGVASFLLTSCDKAKVDVNFDLNIANIDFIVDTTSVTGDVELATTTFTSTLQAELESHDASLDDVQSIRVTGVQFEHLNPQNFDIVDKAYAYAGVPGLPDQRIAYKDPITDGQTLLTMDVDQVDLKTYLAQPLITLKLTGHLSDPNLVVDSLRAHLTFSVQASVKPN